MNSYTKPAWDSAVAAHEKEMYPIETVVAGKLRTQFGSASDRPQQLLREFSKYVSRATARSLASLAHSLPSSLDASLPTTKYLCPHLRVTYTLAAACFVHPQTS